MQKKSFYKSFVLNCNKSYLAQLHGSIALKLIIVVSSVLQYPSWVGGSRYWNRADCWATYFLLLCARHYFKVTSPTFNFAVSVTVATSRIDCIRCKTSSGRAYFVNITSTNRGLNFWIQQKPWFFNLFPLSVYSCKVYYLKYNIIQMILLELGCKTEGVWGYVKSIPY